MKSRGFLVAWMFVAASWAQVSLGQSDLAEYLGYSEGVFKSDRLNDIVSRFSYDSRAHAIVIDGIGLELDRCGEKVECLIYDGVVLVVPLDCALASEGEWIHQEYTFKVVSNLDSFDPADMGGVSRTRFLVSVANRRGEIGYFIYSSEAGVESFIFSDAQGRKKKTKNYHLTSRRGLFAGGCVFQGMP